MQPLLKFWYINTYVRILLHNYICICFISNHLPTFIHVLLWKSKSIIELNPENHISSQDKIFPSCMRPFKILYKTSQYLSTTHTTESYLPSRQRPHDLTKRDFLISFLTTLHSLLWSNYSGGHGSANFVFHSCLNLPYLKQHLAPNEHSTHIC